MLVQVLLNIGQVVRQHSGARRVNSGFVHLPGLRGRRDGGLNVRRMRVVHFQILHREARTPPHILRLTPEARRCVPSYLAALDFEVRRVRLAVLLVARRERFAADLALGLRALFVATTTCC